MSGYLNKANFMKCLSPQGNFHGTDIESVDQCAREHIIRDKERREAEMSLGPAMLSEPEGDWRKRWQLREQMNRRKEPGGATFVPGDGIEHY